MTVVEEDLYINGEPFGAYENDFYVAAGMTEYDGSIEPVDDPTYGTLVFMKK